MRPAIRHFAVWTLLAGLLLRAATPVGYMPGSAGSGLLFELCPGQLPAGFVLPGAQQGHDHHNHAGHGADDTRQAEPDTCQMGHLLSSAVAVGDVDTSESVSFEPAIIATQAANRVRSTARLVHRSRGPPA